ncbi:hypothetical protein [Arcanobacterium phocae]|uniref:hypothetical protein n=1 Tax=Arcanobacterium phocae TaxID=131112 RepID=UPI001C0EE140|nr:hypothetical protein [Arcanobacterium phocae]
MFSYKKLFSVLATLVIATTTIGTLDPAPARATTSKRDACSAIVSAESVNKWQRGRISVCGTYEHDNLVIRASIEDMMYYSVGAWYQQSTKYPVQVDGTISLFLNGKLLGKKSFTKANVGSFTNYDLVLPINTAGTYTIKLDAHATGGYWGGSGKDNDIQFSQEGFEVVLDPKHHAPNDEL